MPDRPHLDSFRRQARALQRAARAGDPGAVARLLPHRLDAGGLRLSAAQLVVAREYGFASWPRLVRYLRTVAEHNWDTTLGLSPAADPAEEFCRLACLTYSREDGPARWERARRLLAEHPGLTAANIWAAAAASRPDDVGRLLGERPRLATERGGPFRWRPLSYLVYSRVDPAGPAEHADTPGSAGHADTADPVVHADPAGPVDSADQRSAERGGRPVAAEGAGRVAPAERVARQLLDAGADPNEGYLFDGLPSPFTLLTGVFGHGELGSRRQPSHPHWRALARLLLDAGADPNDAQTLYNRMFEPDDSHLELLFEYGLGTGDGGPWKARIEQLSTPAEMLRVQLRWAVEHHQAARVRLLVEHGVDFRAPFEGRGPAWSPGDGRTAVDLARLNGDAAITDYLLSLGAVPTETGPVSELIAAAFRADRSIVDQIRAGHPGAVAEARRRRPGLLVWAATQASAETVTLLVELGFDVNAYGRGDAPVEEPWATALHHSAGRGDTALTRLLLELGADPGLRDRRFGATPLDWARHHHQLSTAALLEPYG